MHPHHLQGVLSFYFAKVIKCCNFSNMYIQGVPKKMYTHFKRCYLCKCVHFFWHPRGCQKMYTHFKRCYLCKWVYVFLWHPLYVVHLLLWIINRTRCIKIINTHTHTQCMLRNGIGQLKTFIIVCIFCMIYSPCAKLFFFNRIPVSRVTIPCFVSEFV